MEFLALLILAALFATFANSGHDWDTNWTADGSSPFTLTQGGAVQATSAAIFNDVKSGCEVSIDADYSNHAKATGGLIVYIFRDINGTAYETFGDGGFAFEMEFTQNGTNRRTIPVPPGMTSRFKVGLEWLNSTGSSEVVIALNFRQADIPLAS